MIDHLEKAHVPPGRFPSPAPAPAPAPPRLLRLPRRTGILLEKPTMQDDKSIEELRSEVRYAERLCQRTARLYRRLQTVLTFAAFVGGSVAVGGALAQAQPWAVITGAVLLTVFGGLGMAIRPADKAAQNEADMRRYSALRAAALTMTREQLAVALDQARVTDSPEIEPLRAVAWNDVVTEIGRADVAKPLRWKQRLLAALA